VERVDGTQSSVDGGGGACRAGATRPRTMREHACEGRGQSRSTNDEGNCKGREGSWVLPGNFLIRRAIKGNAPIWGAMNYSRGFRKYGR